MKAAVLHAPRTPFAVEDLVLESIGKALAEVRRIARRHVLLLEPFADCNDLLGRLYLWSMNYFRMRIADLPKHGLKPIAAWTALPAKPTFGYAFVLCQPE